MGGLLIHLANILIEVAKIFGALGDLLLPVSDISLERSAEVELPHTDHQQAGRHRDGDGVGQESSAHNLLTGQLGGESAVNAPRVLGRIVIGRRRR